MSEQEHWLVRPSTIRRIWQWSIALLTVLVLLEFVVPTKGYFGVDDLPAFGAVYGFLCCLAMVLFAKALGFVLKRPDDYYDDSDGDDSEGEDA